MTPMDALLELLGRVGANNGAPVLVNEEELEHWPVIALRAMKSHKLLVKASPATTVVCPGCEQECTMPVNTLPVGLRGSASFIVCDKRDDINRVAVATERLKQWQCNAHAIADLITGLLGLRRPDSGDTSAVRLEVGMFKGRKHSSHIVLLAEGRFTLCVAGHTVALADVLTLEGDSFRLDKQMLIRFVDKPLAGAGDKESATLRRERLKKRVQAEKAKGNKAFLKAVSEDEGVSVSRLKQLLQETSKPTQAQHRRSRY